VKGGLPYELFLGLRYLGSRGKRLNLSVFVWIGVGGVFLGVSALIVVLAVMTGFQDGIRDRIISANPHLLVFQSGGAGMLDAGRVAAHVREVPGVRAATPFVLQQALFTSPAGDAHGGLVRGVDTSDPSVVTDLASQVRSGQLESFAEGGDGILLGAELARTLGVLPGDAVTVISPRAPSPPSAWCRRCVASPSPAPSRSACTSTTPRSPTCRWGPRGSSRGCRASRAWR
jgi:lipoprotein-releasing system permease protein